MPLPGSAISAHTTVDLADGREQVLLVNASGGAITITMPDPSVGGGPGVRVSVKKTDSSTNAVTIDPAGGITIDGAATQVVSAQWDCVVLVTDGTNYFTESDRNAAGSGPSFPGSPADLDIFHHTTHREWFSYDSGNSVWLGPEQSMLFGRGATGQNDTYIRGAGNAPHAAARGYPIPYNIAVTRITANWVTNVTSGNIRVRRDGTNVAALDVAADSSQISGDTGIIYAAFAKGTTSNNDGLMHVYLDSLSTGINNPSVVVFWRRREA